LITDIVAYFSRPYPLKTSGKPQQLSFDIDTKIFHYKYILDSTINYPTEIFIPPLQYPKLQYQIDFSAILKWHISDLNPNIVQIYRNKTFPKASQNESVWVKISPLIKVQG
jgi:hypothetical protein